MGSEFGTAYPALSQVSAQSLAGHFFLCHFDLGRRAARHHSLSPDDRVVNHYPGRYRLCYRDYFSAAQLLPLPLSNHRPAGTLLHGFSRGTSFGGSKPMSQGVPSGLLSRERARKRLPYV